ncbi:MAG TPA: phosphatidylcholine/phosphatidylserine synthase [bacterium]|nr:phosphatidylcholine/phosphatidylserine synthase [bacterium]
MGIKKGIYIPSLITAVNLACGFLSLTASFNREFTKAGWYIIAAWFLDLVDGKIARLTGTSSDFGIEFDSLSHLVSFGVAPGFLYYALFLNTYPFGWAVIFIYVLAVAMRLARYNVKTFYQDRGNCFEGLPSPGAASFLAILAIVYLIFESDRTHKTIPFVMKNIPVFIHFIPTVIFVLSFLMISRIPYSNFSRFKLTGRLPFRIFIFLVFVGLFIWLFPENSVFIILLGYVLSGIIELFLRYWRMRRKNGGQKQSLHL